MFGFACCVEIILLVIVMIGIAKEEYLIRFENCIRFIAKRIYLVLKRGDYCGHQEIS